MQNKDLTTLLFNLFFAVVIFFVILIEARGTIIINTANLSASDNAPPCDFCAMLKRKRLQDVLILDSCVIIALTDMLAISL